MTLCRFRLIPRSPWSGDLRSDTLYGLVCWHVAECEGDRACQNLINSFEEGRAPFELSSAMPANYLPMPLLPPLNHQFFREQAAKLAGNSRQKEEALFDLLQKYKKFRKARWLPLKLWLKHKDSLSAQTLFLDPYEEGQEKDKSPFTESAFEPHVSIDRKSGSAREGELFFTRLNYFDFGAVFHLYARAADSAFLLKYLKLIGETGFGKDASTGKGSFDAELDDEFGEESLAVKESNASLLLSTCSAPKLDNLRGYYHIEVKRGKTGPGPANPFKNPFLMLQEGALLSSLPNAPYVLRDINADSRIVQIMQPLFLQCVLKTGETD